MPSWNDGETSSGSLLSDFCDNGEDLSPVRRIPESTFEPDFTGMETAPALDGHVRRCYGHDLELHRFVAFEGTDTGRRFLACGSKDNAMCQTVHWVDGEWPPTLKSSLLKLWDLYEQEKETRITGNVEYSTANYQLVLEKRELERKNIELHKDLGNSMAENLIAQELISTLKEEKKKLEYHLKDLLKYGEANKKKIKKISEICAE